ncbi:MAG TPA: ATP-binding cassette domain-containing protein, partial [Bryobacteraceae bacterium]|nr:ATP-binding cassette domain-containing protein [Bryobacteraceae bacterium]
MLSGSAAISIRGLTKRYGKLIAVDRLDLEVRRGEVFGFLGLNGAGKTTTIRILLDLLRPTSGNAAVFGHDCQSDSLKARSGVGYLPGEMGIYSDLTGHEMLKFPDLDYPTLAIHHPESIGFVWAPDENGSAQLTPQRRRSPIETPLSRFI